MGLWAELPEPVRRQITDLWRRTPFGAAALIALSFAAGLGTASWHYAERIEVLETKLKTGDTSTPPLTGGFVFRYDNTELDRQTITLTRVIDRTRPVVGMFADPGLGHFALHGIVARNDSNRPLQPDALYVSFHAAVKQWQDSAGMWQLSPDHTENDWTTYRTMLGFRIDPEHPLWIQDFFAQPIPTQPMRVKLTLVYGLKEATALFTVMPPS